MRQYMHVPESEQRLLLVETIDVNIQGSEEHAEEHAGEHAEENAEK